VLFDIKKVCYNFDVENYIKILMDWILENKNKSVFASLLSALARKWKLISISLTSFDNKNSPRRTILQKARLWWGRILRGKKTKTLVAVLFLVCVFFATAQAAYAAEAVTTGAAKIADVGAGIVLLPILVPMQAVMLLLIGIATTIFAVLVDPNSISILNQPALKDVWIMVRDTLNMFFILVLLFSAFCTIFQVDKWNLKKVWLNILINALLVNFSWTIARIIIDISNVAMYYFMNHMFTPTNGAVSGSTIFASIGTFAQLSGVLHPSSFADLAATRQIIMIIFTFIFAITLLVAAILFVIRLIALVLLVMFSPIGFVGYIFPSTASYADDWWKKLFSYAFFAPIMIFGMAVAIKVTQAINNSSGSLFTKGAAANTPASETTWVASLAFFAIPIVILWVTMGVAKSMGIAGAATIVGKAQGIAKGVGKWAVNTTGVPGGIKKGWEDVRKSGKIFGVENKFTKFALKAGQEEREARLSGGISGGKKGWDKAVADKRLKEFNEKIKEKSEMHGDKDGEELAKLIFDHKLENNGDAMDIGALLHHLRTTPDKKEAYESALRESIVNDKGVHASNMAGLTDIQKTAYVNKEVSRHWTELNKKDTQARNFVTKNEKPTKTITKPEAIPTVSSAPPKRPIGFGRS
jgi:hypothetical protein